MDTAQTTGTAAPRRAQAGIATPWAGAGFGYGVWWPVAAAGVLLVALSGCSGDPAVTAVTVAQARCRRRRRPWPTPSPRRRPPRPRSVRRARPTSPRWTATATSSTRRPRPWATSRTPVRTSRSRARTVDAGRGRGQRPGAGHHGRAGPRRRRRPPWPQPRLLPPARRRPRSEASEVPSAEPVADPAPRWPASSRPRPSSPPPRPGSPTRPRWCRPAEQFNSAAVALEMAWLQLFADVRVPDRRPAGAGGRRRARLHHRPAAGPGRRRVLRGRGRRRVRAGDGGGGAGPAEGQRAARRPAPWTRPPRPPCAPSWRPPAGLPPQEEMASTAALQQTLTLAGYWDGPVDGQWTDELTDALKEFQTDLGVKPTGEVDAATIAAFEEALATAQATPTPSPSSVSPTRSPANPPPPSHPPTNRHPRTRKRVPLTRASPTHGQVHRWPRSRPTGIAPAPGGGPTEPKADVRECSRPKGMSVGQSHQRSLPNRVQRRRLRRLLRDTPHRWDPWPRRDLAPPTAPRPKHLRSTRGGSAALPCWKHRDSTQRRNGTGLQIGLRPMRRSRDRPPHSRSRPRPSPDSIPRPRQGDPRPELKAGRNPVDALPCRSATVTATVELAT